MAIYHFSVKDIGRSNGRSAVACSAYRSGENLKDERQGKEQDYTKKTGVEYKKIYAPENAKKELLDRESLWNEVEKVEKRKNSNLAREFEIAFPYELNQEQRAQMLNTLCEKIVERHNVVVDACIHAPHTVGGSDSRNYHAHIMFTGRQLDKATGDFAKNRHRDFNKEKSRETVTQWRKDFADLVNQYLERINSNERVSHLSYKDLKYDLEPTIHEGSKVTQLRRMGIDTEISVSNDLIKARNAEREILRGLEQEIIATERLVSHLKQERSEQGPQHSIFDQINKNLDVADGHLNKILPIDKDRVKNNLEHIKRSFQQIKALKNKTKQETKPNRTPEEKTQYAQQIVRRYEAQLKQEFFKCCEGKTVTSEDFRDMTRRPNELKQAQDNLTRDYPKLANIYSQACQYLDKATEKQRQEQAKKQAEYKEKWAKLPTAEKQKIANHTISRYKRTVDEKTTDMSYDHLEREKIEYSAIQRKLEGISKQLEQEKQDLGKKPLFGRGKWVRAVAEIEHKQKNIAEHQKELSQNPPRLDKNRFEQQAVDVINQENPQLKRQFDSACRYLGRQSEEQKRADQQARLDQAKRIGEQERANKTQLDKEREQRAKDHRQQRPRY